MTLSASVAAQRPRAEDASRLHFGNTGQLPSPGDTPLGEDTLFSSEETATMLRCSTRTLADWRLNGRGPRFVTHSRNYVFYRLGDVRDFIRAGRTPGRSEKGVRA